MKKYWLIGLMGILTVAGCAGNPRWRGNKADSLQNTLDSRERASFVEILRQIQTQSPVTFRIMQGCAVERSVKTDIEDYQALQRLFDIYYESSPKKFLLDRAANYFVAPRLLGEHPKIQDIIVFQLERWQDKLWLRNVITGDWIEWNIRQQSEAVEAVRASLDETALLLSHLMKMDNPPGQYLLDLKECLTASDRDRWRRSKTLLELPMLEEITVSFFGVRRWVNFRKTHKFHLTKEKIARLAASDGAIIECHGGINFISLRWNPPLSLQTLAGLDVPLNRWTRWQGQLIQFTADNDGGLI
ncbi:MAG: hypothetical protein HY602_03400 [Parcubacteria group bacterium]|nr:hypothetical protein [Parcubacteria group bacterium]